MPCDEKINSDYVQLSTDSAVWVNPTPQCDHGLHLICVHVLRHCPTCDKVYCTVCREEWEKHAQWTYTIGCHGIELGDGKDTQYEQPLETENQSSGG